MKASPRRFKFTIGRFFVVLFFLFVLASRWISPLNHLQQGVAQRVFRPILVFSHAVWSPLEGFWSRYVFLLGLRSENEGLRRQNAELTQKYLEAQSRAESLAEFQKIQAAWQKTSFHWKGAEVLAYDPLSPSQGIWINRGAEDGIAPGQSVVTGDGLVGIISKALPRSAKILPIISPDSAVDVELSASGARGILKGKHKSLELDRRYWITRMEYLGTAEKIEEGELVSTSGLDKAYPKGLVVGRLKSVEKDDKGLFVSAEVLPEVDFSKLREVAVFIP